MGNIKIDPSNSDYYGAYMPDGTFKRLGRMQEFDKANRTPYEPHVNFTSSAQRVQYENIVGKPPGSGQDWGDYDKEHNPYTHSYESPIYSRGEFAKKQNRVGVWLYIESSLSMPDGQPFPDEAYTGYMWDIPESKESDGMTDAVKRYRPKGFRPINDQELAEQLAAAARAFQWKMERDMFNGFGNMRYGGYDRTNLSSPFVTPPTD